jgi:TRAP-type C4-dicarboxylate transport system substrate-binding protein
MKKMILVSLAMLLIVGFTSSLCVNSAFAKTTKLLFASFTAGDSFMSDGMKAFAADLEQKSNGRIKVSFSWGSALGKIPEYYDLTVRGVCDVGLANPVQCAKELFPMAEISTLPFNFPSATKHTKALWALYKKGYLDKTMDDEKVKTLFIAGDAGSGLLTYKKKVTTLADVRGLKLHCVPGRQVDIAEAIGAVPVSMAGAEIYMALQTGTIDGHTKGYSPLPRFKWCEVTKYVTEPKLGSVFFSVFMNRKKYNKLPKDIQAIIDEMAMDNKYGFIAAKQMDQLTENGTNCLVKHGVEIVQWEPSSLEVLGKKFQPIWNSWIAEREAKGLPAKQALDLFYKAQTDMGIANPAVGYKPSAH